MFNSKINISVSCNKNIFVFTRTWPGVALWWQTLVLRTVCQWPLYHCKESVSCHHLPLFAGKVYTLASKLFLQSLDFNIFKSTIFNGNLHITPTNQIVTCGYNVATNPTWWQLIKSPINVILVKDLYLSKNSAVVECPLVLGWNCCCWNNFWIWVQIFLTNE